jgi:hypothetical protein
MINEMNEMDEYELSLHSSDHRLDQMVNLNENAAQALRDDVAEAAAILNDDAGLTAPSASLIDHSSQLQQDFESFLFNEQLSDLKIIVRKGRGAFDININSILNMSSL